MHKMCASVYTGREGRREGGKDRGIEGEREGERYGGREDEGVEQGRRVTLKKIS